MHEHKFIRILTDERGGKVEICRECVQIFAADSNTLLITAKEK